jgi:NADH-quinone oxidoreductase subunit M
MFPFLTVLVALPAAASVVLFALPKAARGASRWVALGVALAELVLGAVMAAGFDASAASAQQFGELHAWIPQIGASWALGINGIGLLLVLLSIVLTPLVILAGWNDDEDPDRRMKYLALILALEAFMVLIFAARDVFLFYVAFEAMLIPLYFLIGLFGGEQRRYAAVKFLLFSLVGGLVMLAGVIALYSVGPGGDQGFLTDRLIGLSLDTTTERLIFVAFFFAFAIKAPMVPLHTWLPTVAQTARPGTTTLLVAVLDKVGTFGMISLCLPLFPQASRWAAPLIITFAVVSIIYGALLAIGQKDLLRMVAYSSVSHFGFMVLGIFALRQTSVEGSAFYMLNHGLSTGALFLVVAFLIQRRGSAQIDDFGGLQKVVPVLAGTFLVIGLSVLALPGLSPFVSEIMVLVGAYSAASVAVIIAIVGVVLAALYILLAYQRIFTGPVRKGLEKTPDLSWREKLVAGPLIVAMIVLGFVPGIAIGVLRDPVADVITTAVPAASPAEVSE